MTSSAQTPEPTDEQRQAARRLLDLASTARTPNELETAADAIARALADAVTAEREKQQEAIEAAAKSVEHRMKHTRMALVSGMWAARRIREVSR